jgi:hypothetical protein
MNTTATTNIDLQEDDKIAGRFMGTDFTTSQRGLLPAIRGRKQLCAKNFINGLRIERILRTYLIDATTFEDIKPAPKLSIRCQVRCNF